MNCIIVDDDEMSRKALEHLISQVPYLKLLGAYASPCEALSYMNNNDIDLMLLDIEMPGISGIEFIKSIKTPPLTIFATSRKEYALEAFECNIIDYLVKPISLDRFFKAIAKSKDIFDNNHKNEIGRNQGCIFAKINGSLIKIDLNEILWIEALGDYITINTTEKKYTIHSTLKTILQKLPTDRFVRVHRSYIVAINCINSIDDNTIAIMKQLIPIGYVYKENLVKQLNLL